MRPRRQTHPPHRHLQSPLTRRVQNAQLADHARWYVRVIEPARLLNAARPFHARQNLRRRFAPLVAAQLLIRHRRHFDMDIDAIQQRSADLAEIALDDGGRAPALSRRVPVKSTRAPVQTTTATMQNSLGFGLSRVKLLIVLYVVVRRD